MTYVKTHEPFVLQCAPKTTCPIGSIMLSHLKKALYDSVAVTMRDKAFVGAFALDWQDAEGNTTARIARFDLEHNYERDNPDGDLRRVVADSLDIAAADWMNSIVHWTGNTLRMMYAMPRFLHREGTYIPLGIHGILVMTLLSTVDSDSGQQILNAAESAFNRKCPIM